MTGEVFSSFDLRGGRVGGVSGGGHGGMDRCPR
ncbi:sulfate adenylyltransferase [Streptomyces sp. OF3]|uniref:Sulfate adenylyltransferase n=1 Tax=Streptomyces alkaliterrae TaxID=2213162 RepID=A0A5P0YQH7_9ACTN|nr:sulfate adenylyltransferase [Streptomyces alkaliterrae]MBB1258735.1 sulfate adenylyltransferase [Streptomyces alkaliterrae]MQS02525.1 sulfate adenylyltransferase [Streptomyces alkaliterrae]